MLEFSLRQTKGQFSLVAEGRLEAGVTALLGESGAGKTSLLRLLAGFERADTGHVRLGDKVFFDRQARVNRPVRNRKIGMVFQAPRLLPHLSVRQNARLGMLAEESSFAEITAQFKLNDLFDRPVAALSGGEQQRVVLARAILQKPELFLLDEPMAFLDAAGARELLPFIAHFVAAASVPMIYVTHAVDEAARLAHSAMIMERGKLGAVGPVGAVISAWQGARGDDVAGSGMLSILDATVFGYDTRYGLLQIGVEGQMVEIAGAKRRVGAQVRVLVWARDVVLALRSVSAISARNQLKGQLGSVGVPRNGFCDVSIEIGGQILHTRITEKSCVEMGLLQPDARGRAVTALVKSSVLEDVI